jgi:hypothetical protein
LSLQFPVLDWEEDKWRTSSPEGLPLKITQER